MTNATDPLPYLALACGALVVGVLPGAAAIVDDAGVAARPGTTRNRKRGAVHRHLASAGIVLAARATVTLLGHRIGAGHRWTLHLPAVYLTVLQQIDRRAFGGLDRTNLKERERIFRTMRLRKSLNRRQLEIEYSYPFRYFICCRDGITVSLAESTSSGSSLRAIPSTLRAGKRVHYDTDKFITRHSQVWHWYIQRSPLLKTRWWSSWCLQDAAGSHCGQHLFLWLPGALQSHIGSLQVITPSWQMHLLQGFPAGARVSPLLTSRPSNQQPTKWRAVKMI